MVLGNDINLGKTHIGSSSLSNKFSLSNVLHVPTMHHILSLVSQFCRDNSTSIDFFPSHFVMKDIHTRVTL